MLWIMNHWIIFHHAIWQNPWISLGKVPKISQTWRDIIFETLKGMDHRNIVSDKAHPQKQSFFYLFERSGDGLHQHIHKLFLSHLWLALGAVLYSAVGCSTALHPLLPQDGRAVATGISTSVHKNLFTKGEKHNFSETPRQPSFAVEIIWNNIRLPSFYRLPWKSYPQMCSWDCKRWTAMDTDPVECWKLHITCIYLYIIYLSIFCICTFALYVILHHYAAHFYVLYAHLFTIKEPQNHQSLHESLDMLAECMGGSCRILHDKRRMIHDLRNFEFTKAGTEPMGHTALSVEVREFESNFWIFWRFLTRLLLMKVVVDDHLGRWNVAVTLTEHSSKPAFGPGMGAQKPLPTMSGAHWLMNWPNLSLNFACPKPTGPCWLQP